VPRTFYDRFEVWQASEKNKDLRAGHIAAAVANSVRDRKKQKKPIEPWDFFPNLKPKRKRSDKPHWQGMLDLVKQMNARLGGRVIPKREKNHGDETC